MLHPFLDTSFINYEFAGPDLTLLCKNEQSTLLKGILSNLLVTACGQLHLSSIQRSARFIKEKRFFRSATQIQRSLFLKLPEYINNNFFL